VVCSGLVRYMVRDVARREAEARRVTKTLVYIAALLLAPSLRDPRLEEKLKELVGKKLEEEREDEDW